MVTDVKMSKTDFRIAFNGPELSAHTMDVRDLAPSLLAFSEILVEANRLINGEESRLEMRITPNIKEKCFDIGLEIIQRWELIKNLLGDSNILAAKELLEWLILHKEIAGVVGSGSGLSLLGIYKKLKKKKPIAIIRFNDENGNPLYRYQYEDSDDVILDEKLHRLYQSQKIRRFLERFLAPLLRKDGIEELIAYKSDKSSGVIITKTEAQEIDFEIPEPDEPPISEGEPTEVILRPYSPVYDQKVDKMRFWLGNKHHYMNVSESNIHQIVLNNGGALMEDKFRVMLRVNEIKNVKGEPTKEYTVLEVVEFIPALRQQDMFLQQIQQTDEGE